MKIKGEFVLRELVGETILVPVGRTALQLNGMITLNPVSAQIWRGLDQGHIYIRRQQSQKNTCIYY